MRCYCTSPNECTCDGMPGKLTEREACLEVLKERKRLYGGDSIDGMIRKLEEEIKAASQPSGRDLWIERLTHAMDAEPEPELDEDQEADEIGHRGDASDADKLEGRALWLSRLPTLCDEYSHLYQQRMNYRDGMVYWRRDGSVAE